MNLLRTFKLIMQGYTIVDRWTLIKFYFGKLSNPKKTMLSKDVTLKNENGIFFAGNNIGAVWCTSSLVERYNLPYFKINDGAFIDVGAHFGKYSIMMKQKYPYNKVIAIEPDRNNLQVLSKNLGYNHQEIIIHGIAAWDKPETLTFYMDFDKSGVNSSIEKFPNGVKVTMNADSLDNIIGLNVKVDLIKIDAEGAEEEILRGASGILVTWKPAIIFEAITKHKLKKCSAVLERLGYKVTQIYETYYYAKHE